MVSQASGSGGAPLAIHPLATVEAVHAAAALFDEVWVGDRATMPANILRALEHVGNYVVGVYDGDRMIGASVAFFGAPADRVLHSHITGLLPSHRGGGIGRWMKEHQRTWALERGVQHITWTFDPLIARNAHFNLTVLGATAVEYLVDHYGAMPDAVNRGDASDRLLVRWDIAAPPTGTSTSGEIAVAVPVDVESMRREAPSEAQQWRLWLRAELRGHLEAGGRIAGFDRDRGYLVVGAETSSHGWNGG